ncbi:MAG: glucose-6-phosphate isomerase [Actinomycetaceae bacterium]|nr:glucose-6-phosphate isomerase [Actinomycetaceae bacterium]
MSIDPTRTDAWKELSDYAQTYRANLRNDFACDPQRARTFTYHLPHINIDISKNFLNQKIMQMLFTLADQTHVKDKRDAMFHGEHVNVSENRAALHVALRAPKSEEYTYNSRTISSDIHATLEDMYAFTEGVHSGKIHGATGKPFETIVNIGIGGSDLGPSMAYTALHPYTYPRLECRYISNIDPSDVASKLHDIDPRTTLFIVVSKTFTTMETMTNAHVAKKWIINKLARYGVSEEDAIHSHFVAVSTNDEEVRNFGISPHKMFGFWNWVGGRYSVSSAVGLSLILTLGRENFQEFLDGMHSVDTHFLNAPDEENIPLIMGLLNVWYTNFLEASTHAILPYSQLLSRFPAYLQQLIMESNGKHVRSDGTPIIEYTTSEIVWGEAGTNGQHAFFQLLHQGTHLVPADFIAFVNPSLECTESQRIQHDLFLSNFFAQTRTLAFGKTADEARQEGIPEALISARTFSGNHPSTSILASELTPRVLGELIALYEHITFVQSAVWGINPFDQWGVELGKQVAKDLMPAMQGDTTALSRYDSSTQELITYYQQHKKTS